MSVYDAGRARAFYEIQSTQAEAAQQRLIRGYVELEAAQRRATRPASLPALGGGPAAGGASRASSFAQDARAQASLEAQQARLARVQGDGARAAELEAQAQQRLSAALVRTDTTTSQAIGLQRQLVSVQTQAARAAQQAAQGTQQITRDTIGFTGTLGGLRSALGGLGIAFGAQQLISFGIESGRTGLALDRTERLTRELTGTQERYNQVVVAARQQQALFGGSLQSNIEDLSGFAVQSRLTGVRLESLIDLSQRLSVLDPEQGIRGASVALREALSGDPISLAKRFEIPRVELAKLRDTSTTTAEKLQVISDFLDKAGIKSGALARATSETQQTYNQLGATLDAATTSFGLFVAQGLEPAARGLDRLVRLSQDNPDAFREILQSIADFNTGVQGSTTAAVNPAIRGIAAYNDAVLRLAGIQAGTTTAIESQSEAMRQSAFASLAAARATHDHATAEDEIRQQRHLDIQAAQEQQQAIARLTAGLGEQAGAHALAAQQAALLKQNEDGITSTLAQLTSGTINQAQAESILTGRYGVNANSLPGLIALTFQLAGARAASARADLAARGARPPTNLTEARLPGGGAGTSLADRLGGGAGTDARRRLDEQDRIRQAQNALDLARARTAAQRIAVLEREKAATTDVAEKIRIQASIEAERNSGAKAHTTELDKQLGLNERVRDSLEAQLKASVDARKLAAQDTLDRLKEDQQLAQARRVLATSHDERFRQAAQARIDLIGAERDERQLALRQAQATAGGTLVNGRVFQSLPGGGAPQPIPALPLAGGAPSAVQGAAGGLPSGLQVLVLLDGEQIAAKVETRVVSNLRQSRQQSVGSGGGVR
jgi:hypothetical protein